MNTEKLLAKFAAARTKQAQEEDPSPIGSTQRLFGGDPFSTYDQETDSMVNMTMAPAALAGGLYGAYGLGGTGRAINRAAEASRYINPLFRKNPYSGSRSFAPTLGELLLDPSIDPSIGQRAVANVMPSLATGGDANATNFQEFARPPARQAQPGTTQQPRTMDVTPVGGRLNRRDAMKLLTGSFLAPYMAPGGLAALSGNDPNEPGRISYMGGGTPATNKRPAVPDTELQSVTRQQLLTQRPALGLLDPRLIGEGAAPIRYVSPTEPYVPSPSGAAMSYIRPPVGTTDASGVISGRENPLRRALGRAGNFMQAIDPKTGKARTATGLLGGLAASEGASYLQGDTNPVPFIADVKYDSPLR